MEWSTVDFFPICLFCRNSESQCRNAELLCSCFEQTLVPKHKKIVEWSLRSRHKEIYLNLFVSRNVEWH